MPCFRGGNFMEKIFLIGNPCSGTLKLKNNLLDIVRVFSDSGYTVTVYPTKSRGDATQVVASLGEEYSSIICCGGDGTLNEVIAGMMQNKNHFDLGYIPAGTLNEWSSGLHISRNMVTAAKDIVSGQVIPLDIGMFSNRYFTYTASFGAFTDASYSASQEVKNVLGQAAYFFEGIKSLANIKPYAMSFECEGKVLSGEFLFGSVSNSMSVGGIIKLNETTVHLNDGLFEVLLVRKPENIDQLNHIITGILKRDFSSPCIEFFRASSLTVKAPADVAWTLDGEQAFPEGDEFKIENIHSAISFYVPKDK